MLGILSAFQKMFVGLILLLFTLEFIYSAQTHSTYWVPLLLRENGVGHVHHEALTPPELSI